MPERVDSYFSAPAAWMNWIEEGSEKLVECPVPGISALQVIGATGLPCECDSQGRFVWTTERPRQVLIRWMEEGEVNEVSLPLLDAYGRLAAAALPALDVEQAWWQLANFPAPPDTEVDEPDESEVDGKKSAEMKSLSSRQSQSYPIREMMQLVENIADKQTEVLKADWQSWCIRLEQCLVQARHSETLRVFVEMNLNPISPLWERPFRPVYAEDAQSPEGLKYEKALRAFEASWKVESLNRIGDGS